MSHESAPAAAGSPRGEWHILKIAALLSPATVVAGYLMWITPSKALYGRNVASTLLSGWDRRGFTPLLEAGLTYVAVAGLAAFIAYAVRLHRLSPSHPAWSRRTIRGLEAAFWFLVVGALTVVLHVVPNEATAGRFLDPRGGTAYVALHVIVLAASFRSLAGLIRSLKHPIEAERRADGPAVRLATGVLVLALCYLQVLLAMSFGALGPNPAKRLHPVVVVEQVATGLVDRQMFLIRHGEGVIVAFDPARDAIVELPRTRFVDVWQPTHTLGQHAVLEHVDAHGSITRAEVDSLLCPRRAIAAAELHHLLGTGALHETRPDTYVAG